MFKSIVQVMFFTICFFNIYGTADILRQRPNQQRNSAILYAGAASIAAAGLFGYFKRNAIKNFFKGSSRKPLEEVINQNSSEEPIPEAERLLVETEESIDGEKKEELQTTVNKGVDLEEKENEKGGEDISEKQEEKVDVVLQDRIKALEILKKNLSDFRKVIAQEQTPEKIDRDIESLKSKGFIVEEIEIKPGAPKIKHVFKMVDGKKIDCGPLLFTDIFRTVSEVEDFFKIKLNNKKFKEYFLNNPSKLTFNLRFDSVEDLKNHLFDNKYLFIQLANNYGLQGDGGAQEGAGRKNNPYVSEFWDIILKNHNNFGFKGAFHFMGAEEGYSKTETDKIKALVIDKEIAKYIFTENREITFESGTPATLFGTAAIYVPNDDSKDTYKNAAINILRANYYSIVLQALIKSFQINKPIRLLFTAIGTNAYNNKHEWYEQGFTEAFADVYTLIKNSIGADFQMPLNCERVIYKEGVPDKDKNSMALANKNNKAEYEKIITFLKQNCNYQE